MRYYGYPEHQPIALACLRQLPGTQHVSKHYSPFARTWNANKCITAKVKLRVCNVAKCREDVSRSTLTAPSTLNLCIRGKRPFQTWAAYTSKETTTTKPLHTWRNELQFRYGRYGKDQNLFLLPGIEPRFLGRPARCLVTIPAAYYYYYYYYYHLHVGYLQLYTWNKLCF